MFHILMGAGLVAVGACWMLMVLWASATDNDGWPRWRDIPTALWGLIPAALGSLAIWSP